MIVNIEGSNGEEAQLVENSVVIMERYISEFIVSNLAK